MKQFDVKRFVLFFLVVTGWACQGFDEQLRYNQANRYHDEGRFAQAIEIYQSLLASDPENKKHPNKNMVRYDLGMAYLDEGKRQKAHEQAVILRKARRDDLATLIEQEMVKRDMLR